MLIRISKMIATSGFLTALECTILYSVYCVCLTKNVVLADRTNGRAYATVLRLSVSLSVCDVMYCG